jgi:hypothetical protein
MVKFKKVFRKLDDPRAANASHDLLEILFNLIRSHPAQNSMRQKIKRAAWDDSFLLGLLGHMR